MIDLKKFKQVYEEAKLNGLTEDDIPTLTRIVDNLFIVVEDLGSVGNGYRNVIVDRKFDA